MTIFKKIYDKLYQTKDILTVKENDKPDQIYSSPETKLIWTVSKEAAWESWKYNAIQFDCEFPYNENDEKSNFEIWWNEEID